MLLAVPNHAAATSGELAATPLKTLFAAEPDPELGNPIDCWRQWEGPIRNERCCHCLDKDDDFFCRQNSTLCVNCELNLPVSDDKKGNIYYPDGAGPFPVIS